jgi:hypothetical protein
MSELGAEKNSLGVQAAIQFELSFVKFQSKSESKPDRPDSKRVIDQIPFGNRLTGKLAYCFKYPFSKK